MERISGRVSGTESPPELDSHGAGRVNADCLGTAMALRW
jgi:hypothetical protein